jgi:NAD(P)-dependent dehydrogenase (short-subunit alcohol dehydrogenase family)
VPMDVLEEASVRHTAEVTLDRFGRIDVLVNNAIYQGPGGLSRFADLTDEQLDKLFTGNLFAQLTLIRAVLPGMIARGNGTIINLVSGSGYLRPPAPVGQGGWSVGYAMTKAAFGRVAPVLHVEYADLGIRLFSVDPGLTVTERTLATGRARQYASHYRPATPDVIGRAIRWLATSDEADELRGRQVMAQEEVDRRGLLARWPAPVSQDRPWEQIG